MVHAASVDSNPPPWSSTTIVNGFVMTTTAIGASMPRALWAVDGVLHDLGDGDHDLHLPVGVVEDDEVEEIVT